MTIFNARIAFALSDECKVYFRTWLDNHQEYWYCELDKGHSGLHAAPTRKVRE